MKNDLSRDEARARAELVRDVRYEIRLDLTNEEVLVSDSTVRFRCAESGARTFLDLTAPAVRSIEVNGEAVDAAAFDGHRLHLDGLERENTVRVVAECAYNRTEVGMHRFVDPVDGTVYAHTHLEPFGAHRVFACFDQPDLKAPYDFRVTVPPGWEVVANSKPTSTERGDETDVWTFATTRPIPAYITAVCAGQFHVVRDRHRDIELGLLCRRSLAEHMDVDELFAITKAGFDFFERAFGYPYMFDGKYDQVFIPESNSGAMENAGCVTFNDVYLFRSRYTDAAYERRAETILHEMAHMWFGDLVTMRWWDDLWLNESFASYMAVYSEVGATRWTDAWTTFADSEKTWAYRQDQLPTTHPIVADVPSVEAVHLNFDGISYAKGASVLKQLVAWVGEERFLEGIKVYVRRHEYGNADLDEFLAALEEGSGRDLQAWSKEWLESAGVNTLRAEFETADDGTFSSFALLQEAHPDWPTLRSHRLGIGLYDAEVDGLRLRLRVELDAVGERTDVADLVGERMPDLALINDGDLTFSKIRLDERSLRTVVERLGDLNDSLARALCWTAAWDMTRDGEMPARDYLRLVIGNIGSETKVSTVQSLLAQAGAAVSFFGNPSNRGAAGQALAERARTGLGEADPGSDHQLAWARAFIANARSDEHLAMAHGLLDGTVGFDGLAVDTELRWHIVRSLAAAGAIDESVIAAEEERDPTDRGSRHGAAARAARPTAEAKAWAWGQAVDADGLPLAYVDELMSGFMPYAQEELLAPYAERFFEVLPEAWVRKDLPDALAFGRRMYPHLIVDQSTVDRTDAYLRGQDVPAPARRLLLEGRDGIVRALKTRSVDASA
jgi:aminopeptidase N